MRMPTSYIVVSPTEYACSGWKYRGLSVCDNTIKVSRQLVEALLLTAADGKERFLIAEVSGDYAGLFRLVRNCNVTKNKFGGGEGS